MRRISRNIAALAVILTCFAFASAFSHASQPQSDHEQWIADSLKEMQRVKVGMTREDLLKIFVTEGGLYTRSHRTYVYRGCPYIKVDVEFQSVGPSARDQNGRETLIESPNDVIAKISKPYLDWSNRD